MAVVCDRFDDLGFDGTPRRLGIMGGTFDPIHIGHLACAEQAREAFGLDAVVFVPAGNPVFKKSRAITPADLRLEMCRLAVESNPRFDVSPLEIERGGDTYTVDTLRQLRAHYPDTVELFFITGADAVLNIVKWRESAAIATMARLIAVTRPGYALGAELERQLREAGQFRVDVLEATALSVSSSDLRDRVAAGKSIRYLTMLSVYDFIRQHGLYGYAPDTGYCAKGGVSSETGTPSSESLTDSFFAARRSELEHRLKLRRFEHTLGVADTARHLAEAYGVDARKAELAGLLHDWDKTYDDEGIKRRARELDVAVDGFVLEEMPEILHGMTAAAALRRRFPTLPFDVLQAIDRHTTGAVGMTDLDMIVYVADAIEPHRDYPGIDRLRAMVGASTLEDLFLETLRHVTLNLIERRKRVYPRTLDVWNYYIARARKAQADSRRKEQCD